MWRRPLAGVRGAATKPNRPTQRMPTLKYKNRALAFFTASKKHMSLFPSSWAIEEFEDRLADYKTSDHAIQFTLEKPLPTELIEDLVRYHKRQIDAERHD